MSNSVHPMQLEKPRLTLAASCVVSLALYACAPAGAATAPPALAQAPPAEGPPAGAQHHAALPDAERPADAQPGAGPATAPPEATASGAALPAEPPAPPKPPPVPPKVELSETKFVGQGEVPKADVYLRKTLSDVGECVAKHGGLSETPGHIEMQLLVRDRGRAEGVEVLSSKGVGDKAARCVRDLLRGKWVGSPTADPAGVMFRYELTEGG